MMLRTIFKLSKTEMNGLLVLAGILIVGLIIPCYLVFSEKSEDAIPFIATDPSEPTVQRHSSVVKRETKEQKETTLHSLPKDFSFDPNEMNEELGRILNLKEYQTKMIMRYLEKGGRFKTPTDFKKIYALKSEDYSRLSPYIRIEQYTRESHITHLATRNNESNSLQAKSPRVGVKIALNSTDSLSLQAIKGIGPVLSARIIKYRDRLGGFHHVAQLKEVYGLDSAVVARLAENLQIDVDKLRKIPINNVSWEELRRFPYLNYKQCKIIINYRLQHGKFKDLEDIAKIKILDEEILRKIAPYFEYND